jgi:Core-2/I-Branching enzyme
LLQADIDCMKDHLSRPAAVRWRYLLNVAGQAYPLRTPEEMVDILRIYNGSNDIEGLSYRRRIFSRFSKVKLACALLLF